MPFSCLVLKIVLFYRFIFPVPPEVEDRKAVMPPSYNMDYMLRGACKRVDYYFGSLKRRFPFLKSGRLGSRKHHNFKKMAKAVLGMDRFNTLPVHDLLEQCTPMCPCPPDNKILRQLYKARIYTGSKKTHFLAQGRHMGLYYKGLGHITKLKVFNEYQVNTTVNLAKPRLTRQQSN